MSDIIEKVSTMTSTNVIEYVVLGVISFVILCLIYAIYSCVKYLKVKDLPVIPTQTISNDDEKFDIFKAANSMKEALEGQTVVFSSSIIEDEVDASIGHTSLKRRREIDNTIPHSVKDIIDAMESANIDTNMFESDEATVIIEAQDSFKPAKIVSPVYGFARPEPIMREMNSKEVIAKSNNLVKEELQEAENLLNNLKELRKTLG